jgi:hypothetical protein
VLHDTRATITADQALLLRLCLHSSGNHAAALARAASLRGIPSWIVVPSNTPQCKVDAVKEYGGEQREAAGQQEVLFCSWTCVFELTAWVQSADGAGPTTAVPA